jgi:hypothetical protein
MPIARSSSPSTPGPPFVVLLAVLAALVASAADGGAERSLSSAWRGEPIRIDGNDEEWRGRMTALDKDRFALGLQNDGDAVYLCLTTRDRVLGTQIARQGLMVWLDPGPARPRKHVFGVHFPIDPRLQAGRDPGGRWPPEGAEVDDWSQQAVGILGPAKGNPLRVPIADAGGIAARVKFHGDVLVYELRVPLHRAAPGPYAVNAEPGGSICLEIATPEWRGSLPPSRGPIGITAAAPGSGGRGVIGYPSVDATYLKQTDVKAVVRLAGNAAG